MPYDPRMMQQMGQYGVGMMQGGGAQQDRPPQWWETPMPKGRGRPGQIGQSANDPGQSANSPNAPPSLYDMMLNLGRMSRPQYDKAVQGSGAYGISPQTAGAAGPMAFLGSMGMPGGAGWGGGGAK
jgi:hypothetical protein